MSDESEPTPSHRSAPFDDHAAPTDDGYGYYEVEEYGGDPWQRPPSVEPDTLLDDIASERPLFARPDVGDRRRIEPTSASGSNEAPEFDPAAFDPPRVSRPSPGRRAAHRPGAFDPPDAAALAGPVGRHLDRVDHADGIDGIDGIDGVEDGIDDVDGADDELAPIVRTGRVPFAERNWRIPTIITLVVAMIVIGTVILLLPDDGIVEQDDSALIELRTQPSKQWDEDLDGFASGTAFDSDTLYTVIGRRSRVEVVAIDLDDGDERWRTELGPGGESSVGDIVLGDEGLTVVVDSGTSPGVLATLAADSGDIGWQVAFDGEQAEILTESLVRSVDAEGAPVIGAIDRKNKRWGLAAPARIHAIDGDRILVDDGRVLTRRMADTLEPDEGFAYRHSGDIVATAFVDGDPIVAIGNEIIRLDDNGRERFAYQPEVGVIRSLLAMQGDALLVGGTGRIRAVTINGDDAQPITDVRTSLSAVAVADTEGGELILGAIANGAGGEVTLRVLRVSDAQLEPVAEIDLSRAAQAAPIVVVGTVVYSTSVEAVPRFVAADLADGQRLWSFPLIEDDDTVIVTGSGVILLSDEDDETIVTFYAPAD